MSGLARLDLWDGCSGRLWHRRHASVCAAVLAGALWAATPLAAQTTDANQSFARGELADYVQSVWPELSGQPAPATLLMTALALEHGEPGNAVLAKYRAEADKVASLTPWRQAVAGRVEALEAVLGQVPRPVAPLWRDLREVAAGCAAQGRAEALAPLLLGLEYLAVLSPGASTAEAQELLQAWQWEPAEQRAEWAALVSRFDAKERRAERHWSLRLLKSSLFGLPGDRLQDPFLTDLILRLTPSDERLDRARQLLSRNASAPATALVDGAAAEASDDPVRLGQVASMLQATGRDLEAVKLLRQGEAADTGPGGRQLRLTLLRLIHAQCPTCPA